MVMTKDNYILNFYSRFPMVKQLEPEINMAVDMLHRCIISGGKIILCGNGGSAADAEHVVGELMKAFLRSRPLTLSQQEKLSVCFPVDGLEIARHLQQPIPAISLVAGVSLPTAFANDVAGEYVFAQQVFGLGKAGDVLWGISTSGNSKNVVHAFKVARAFGLKTFGLTGRGGGEIAEFCDVVLRVPADSTPEIQELHLPLYHFICARLEQICF